MSSFYTTGDQKPRVQLLATVSLVASCSQLPGIQSVTTNNLIAGRAQSLKKTWSLVFKGVVWAECKLSAGVVVIISFGLGSCAGKVGAYAWLWMWLLFFYLTEADHVRPFTPYIRSTSVPGSDKCFRDQVGKKREAGDFRLIF